MGVRRSEIRVPCIEVSIKVHHRNWSVFGGHRTEQRKCDGVISPNGDDSLGAFVEFATSVFDVSNGSLKVKGIDANVAGIGYLALGKGRHILGCVIGSQQTRGGAHVARTKARPRTIGNATIKRDA